jgi:hypothetical protein
MTTLDLHSAGTQIYQDITTRYLWASHNDKRPYFQCGLAYYGGLGNHWLCYYYVPLFGLAILRITM